MENNLILTYTGVKLDPSSPKAEDIRIKDIAHALSFLTRANGHLNSFFSVAQHSINCALEAEARGLSKMIQLACLLHDASEAYLSDITRPVKHKLTQYLDIEKTVQQTIMSAFGLDSLTENDMLYVSDIDDAMLYHELLHFTGRRIYEIEPEIILSPDFSAHAFSEVEYKFLEIFEKLSK